MDESIVLEHIVKTYDCVEVLSDISYSFDEGKAYCLMGKSGSGKTTLLRILMGLEKPDSGKIHRAEGLKVSAVFQENRLCNNLSSLLNVKMVVDEKKISDACISDCLNEVGIDAGDKKTVSEYSGGMARRVALVRAILSDSDIVLLDEPFYGLDKATKDRAVAFIKSRIGKRTLIISTHNEEDVSLFDAGVLFLGK